MDSDDDSFRMFLARHGWSSGLGAVQSNDRRGKRPDGACENSRPQINALAKRMAETSG
jgi:hypothetical protein